MQDICPALSINKILLLTLTPLNIRATIVSINFSKLFDSNLERSISFTKFKKTSFESWSNILFFDLKNYR